LLPSSKAIEFYKSSFRAVSNARHSWPHVSGQLQLMKGVKLHYKSPNEKHKHRVWILWSNGRPSIYYVHC